MLCGRNSCFLIGHNHSPSSFVIPLGFETIDMFGFIFSLVYRNSFPPFPGGFFFARPMRENRYLTMMDPFQQKYGNVMSSLLILPALVADVLWVARTLVSLGKLPQTVNMYDTIMCAHKYFHTHTYVGTHRSGYTMSTNIVEKQSVAYGWCCLALSCR